MNKPKLISASAYAAIICSMFVVVITIGAELFTPLKDWLKNFSGHHWTSKSILTALIYTSSTLLLYLIPYPVNEHRLKKTLDCLLGFTALGLIIVILFFTFK